jgi:hypothetical protein
MVSLARADVQRLPFAPTGYLMGYLFVMDLVGTIDRMRRLRSDLPDVEVKSAKSGLPDSITESL